MSPFSFADAFDTVEATVCDPETVGPTVVTEPQTLMSLDIPERALGRGAHGEGDGGTLEATGHREPSPVTGRAQGGGKRGRGSMATRPPPLMPWAAESPSVRVRRTARREMSYTIAGGTGAAVP